MREGGQLREDVEGEESFIGDFLQQGHCTCRLVRWQKPSSLEGEWQEL